MLRKRAIPTLLLHDGALVKTVNFNRFQYIGDPANTVRIFNELEVDELIILDILATKQNKKIDFNLLEEITSEAFMPLSYGGGINSFEDARKLFSIGFEKIIINTALFSNLDLLKDITNHYGTQSVIGSIDVKKNIFGKYQLMTHCGKKLTNLSVVGWAKELFKNGAGELMITSIDREGTWSGFDVELTKSIVNSVDIPVITNGGAGSLEHIEEVINKTDVSAIAFGSMVVYQNKGKGVLVNFPDSQKLKQILE